MQLLHITVHQHLLPTPMMVSYTTTAWLMLSTLDGMLAIRTTHTQLFLSLYICSTMSTGAMHAET